MSKSKSTAFNLSELNYKQYYWILAVVVIIVFGNTLFNGYNYDDNLVTMHHPLTSKGIKSIGKIFTSPYYSNGADINFGYRPIVHLSFAIEHQFFGEKPGVSHFFNLLIYLGCVLAFFKLISSWFSKEALLFAFCTAVLFAVHPVHSEAVASIKNRDELLAFLFAMLAFVQLNKYSDKQQWWRIGLFVLFFVIGLLAKKSIYPLVFLVPLILTFIHEKTTWKTLVSVLIFCFLSSVVASDLDMNRFLSLSLISMFWSTIIFVWSKKQVFTKLLSNETFKLLFFLLFLLISIAFTIASVYHKDYSYFVLSLLILAVLLYRQDRLTWVILVITLELTALAYYLSIQELNLFALLLSSVYAIPKLAKKEIRFPALVAVLISVVAMVAHHIGLGVIVLAIQIVVAAFFMDKNRIISLLLFIGPVVAAYFTGSIIPFHLSLVAVAMLMFSKVVLPKFTHLTCKPYILVLLMLFVFVFLPNTPLTKARNYWTNIAQKEVQVDHNIQSSQSLHNPQTIGEGRGLNYVENTLVGNQTKEAIVSTGVLTLGEYMKLLVFPNELSFYYGFAKLKTGSFSNIYVWFWLAFFVVVSFGCWWVFRNQSIILIAYTWLFFSLLLFSNWIELVAGMVGERLAFTSSGGFCLLLGLLVYQLANNVNRKPILYTFFFIIILLSFRTIARNSDWKSHLALMEHDMEHLSESVYAQHMFAQTCMTEATTNAKLNENQKMQLVVKAEQALIKAVTIYPRYFNAQFDLARIYLSQQRFLEAKNRLEIAYKLDTTNLFVLEELTKTCFDLNLNQETIDFGKHYLNSYTQNENVYEIVAYTLFKIGSYKEAKNIAENGLVNFPQGRNLKGLLIDINKHIGDSATN